MSIRWMIMAGLMAVLIGGQYREAAGQVPELPGTEGAQRITVTMPIDGQATIALYTPEGQLVRILGQLLDLKQGEYIARWDGMDLWGNVLPAGTELVCRVFSTPGVKAYYEFTVGHANTEIPWLTSAIGEGAQRRQGGWLGDHSPPNRAQAVGDLIFLSCDLAEDGHNLIAVNQLGQKLYGTQMAGWTGPSELATDGKRVYARTKNTVFSVDPATWEKKRLYSTDRDDIQSMTVHGNEMLMVLRNHASRISPFRRSGARINFAQSQPQILTNDAPEHQIGGQSRLAQIFSQGWHFQVGVTPIIRGNDGHLVIVFNEPIQIGTAIVHQVRNTETLEIRYLKEGMKFDPGKHDPIPKADDPMGGLDALAIGLADEWVDFGKTNMPGRLNLLTAPQKPITTQAIHIRLVKSAKVKNWRPTVRGIRLLANRISPATTDVAVKLPDEVTGRPAVTRHNVSWRYTAPGPITDFDQSVVVMDYKKPITLSGMIMLNNRNPKIHFDMLEPDADPANAPESAWIELTQWQSRTSKAAGWHSASTQEHEVIVDFQRTITTRAIRMRYQSGLASGRDGLGHVPDQPAFVSLDAILPLQLGRDLPRPPASIVQRRRLPDGEVIDSFTTDDLADLTEIKSAPDGTLYAIVANQVRRMTISDQTVSFTPVTDVPIKRASSLATTADHLIVGDRGAHAVLVLDHQGQLQRRLSSGHDRQRGPWNPMTLARPSGMTVDSAGQLWVAEQSFAPKRVAVYSLADGRHVRDLLGPPMYGGGGSLTADLKHFFYRGVQYAVDFEKGTSRIAFLNDRAYTEETPALENNTFIYTSLDYPLVRDGQLYLMYRNGTVIVQVTEDGDWKPCVVMDSAHGSVFLERKKVWREHWMKQDLTGKYFIWHDLNDDGEYQIEEVRLFDIDKDFGGKVPTAGGTIAKDFTIWGRNARLTVERWTPGGVPIYDLTKAVAFDYDQLAPVYHRNFTLGGPQSAKPGYNGFKLITQKGRLIQEGQPYIVEPDGSIFGGPVTAKPSDYIPPINGKVLNQPWKFAGSAMTKSPVGEVATLNSNNGFWYVWAADYGVIVGEVFTGDDGGWSTDLPAVRGTDVTGRKHGWEGWGSYLVQADNDKVYAVAGKAFHGISRIERLDDFRIDEVAVRVSKEDFTANTKLRPMIVDQYNQRQRLLAMQREEKRSMIAPTTRERLRDGRIAVDGDLGEWGKESDMQVIGFEPEEGYRIAASYDESGIYLAYKGKSFIKNGGDDWRQIFTTGFGFDFRYRSGGDARAREVVAGDRRIVFAPHQGKWTAVLYDYINDEADPDEGVDFTSPLGTTSVARVIRIPEDQVKIAFQKNELGVDWQDIDKMTGGSGGSSSRPGLDLDAGLTPTAPTDPFGGGRQKPADKPAAGKESGERVAWAAEVFIPWDVLGLQPGQSIKADFGVHDADSGGRTVERRIYWSNASNLTVSDVSREARIDPVTWGSLSWKK